MTDLPFQTEYAKSGRAKCKGCKESIAQGELRIAIMVQSAFHDGKQPNWHHEKCFFQKARVQSVSDIENFNKLKPDDKKRLKSAIESNTGVALPVEKGKGKKKRAAQDTNLALKDFKVEYSASNRATCKSCDIKICKDEIRICKIRYDTEVGMKYGGQPFWYHLKCFVEERDELGYMAGGDDLPGFNQLKKNDKALVKNEIKPKSVSEVPVKKIKTEPKDEEEMKKEKDFTKKLEKQDKLFQKYRSALSELSKNDLHELLEVNNQEILSGLDECRDHLADCMAFGVPEPCPECKGQLVLHNFSYKCKGNISEWTKCQYTSQEPLKKPMVIPKAFKEGSVFKKYKATVAVRLFESAPPPPVIVKPEPTVKKEIPIPPLKNLQFLILGLSKSSKSNIEKRILKMGGLVVSKVTETIAAVVSTAEEIEKSNKKMKEVSDSDIEVVDETFLDLIDPKTGSVANTLELIKLHNIAPWGSDPLKRVPQDVVDGKSIKSGSLYVKSSKSTTTKLKIKGGTAVDPASGLEDVAHVYTDAMGTKYTVVLGKTDVVAQKNSYYKLQILQADTNNKFWLFRSWGRIGTTIGGTKVEDCRSLQEAIDKFEDLYMEKTQNPWECRHDFQKVPDGYYPIDVDYSDDVQQELKTDADCKLPVPVQDLILKIFDISLMKMALSEFELDTEKMPLGKISKSELKKAYKILSELLKYIENGAADKNKIIDATNRFFTMVPHDFGVENPPLLDNEEAIKKKCEMIDSLLEIEIAYSLLKTDSDMKISPVEAHYLKLKTLITPLDRNSPDFQLIQEYVRNTHAATHSNYTLEIQEVFTVVRDGEEKRYKPFRKLHNRRLLWHGSRVTNFAGILSQGLRIAPPEAPVTGYMFGKGIYFADMVSKSANYCNTSSANPVGIMLLCEVALGNMKECTNAEMITQLPADKHSTWGIGRNQPNMSEAKTLDNGVIVPLGKPVEKKIKTSLLYNEFIVYDVAQVNVKYLMQMKFNYKY